MNAVDNRIYVTVVVVATVLYLECVNSVYDRLDSPFSFAKKQVWLCLKYAEYCLVNAALWLTK